MTSSEALITKYRPNTLEDVVGHAKVVGSLENAMAKGLAHCFLFSGPSGLGKTTLAMIVANELKCEIEDIDAARYNGVDEMRAIADATMYRPLTGANKAIILDESHLLSKQAWTALLKSTEKPPSYVYWFFCTTELAKVPAAIKTRSLAYELKPVPRAELENLLAYIHDAEKLKVRPEIVRLCAAEAGGSPRQAISNLVACAAAKTVEDAAELLASAEQSAEAVELARALYNNAGWGQLQKICAKLTGVSSESIRQVVRAYGTAIALKAPEQKAARAIEVLDHFTTPFNSHDGITPVLIACAKITMG